MLLRRDLKSVSGTDARNALGLDSSALLEGCHFVFRDKLIIDLEKSTKCSTSKYFLKMLNR